MNIYIINNIINDIYMDEHRCAQTACKQMIHIK